MSRQYREFTMGDLFEVLLGVNVPHKHLLLVGEYGVITGSTERNGCAGYLDDIGNYLLKENVITVSNRGEHSGTAFYQDKKVIIGSNVLCLIPKIKLNKYIGLYICVVINNLGYGGYTNYPTKNKIGKDLLLLPITSQGEPDWQYMEDYMEEIESETQQTIETLDKISTLSSVGVSSYPEPYGYREFKVGDLFNIQPTKNYKMINKELFVEGGINPVIVNTKFRNGVGGYTDKECTEDGGIITFSDTTNWESIFYQSKPFVGYPHVQGMYPKDSIEDYINMYNMMYIVTTFKVSAQSQGFDYQNKFNRKVAKELNIKLPITSQGGPDWQYMEDFMRYIEQESEEVINKIQNMS